MSDTSPRLGLPYIQPAQAQKHVTHNEALRQLDVLVQLGVVAFDATTPPTLPQEGDVYALGSGAGGDWTGHDGDLAVSVDGYWQFHTPAPGWLATLAGSAAMRVWSGSAWVAPGADQLDNLTGVGINTTSDSVNRLAVSSAATLLSHEGDDHRLKINKASASDTASLLFQSDWSGRAEMGLAGSDGFSIKVSADGSAWIDALTVDPATGEVSLRDTIVANAVLAGENAVVSATAVDLCAYNTAFDSDGGAWRKRCQDTSWYNETLNTATRGARAGFPAAALIVAEADTVTIHDADNPELPMWRVWDFSGYTVSSVAALGGKIVVGLDGDGLVVIDLAGDEIGVTPRYSTVTSPALVSDAVNAAAITVRPGAPADPATGLAVPTIAVATDGGISVIHNDGTVADLTYTITEGAANFVTFADAGVFYLSRAYDTTANFYGFHYLDVPAADSSATPDRVYSYEGSSGRVQLTTPIGGVNTPLSGVVCIGDGTVVAGSRAYSGNTGNGIYAIKETGAAGEQLIAHTTSDHTTGWMPGDIKGAWLADTDASDLVGGTDADRSVAALDLPVTGTITRAPVATSAELVAYSGFSSGVNELTLTDASIADTLFGLCWVETSAGVWELQSGVMSGAPIEGVSIAGTTLTVAGAKAKALLRLTATTPSADQLAKIEADERALFQDGAACTLYGASDAVTALAHDPVTGLLHVGTSAGRSDFQGFSRIANTTTAVTTAISAVDGLVSEQ